MRIAQSWLTEILQRANAGWSVTPAELDAGFVRVGLEVEGAPEQLPQVSGPLTIGRVSSIEELEGFKKPIRFCLVDVGAAEPQQIVCGARNFASGDLVVVALPGTVLPGGFEIGKRETYGKPSEGMICSASELGIGSDHSGIIVLAPGTAEPGTPAGPVLDAGAVGPDTVIELNVTPDRGYCLSARGLARELACGFDLDFADPAVELGLPAGGETWPLEVAEEAGAQRFALRRVTGVDPSARTPWWMVRRLLLSGVRPISPAVDVTNYVMLELGHPMHAFDAATLRGGLTVRRARAGEKLTTLDDAVRTLDPEDVVICDDRGPISLAGVMGGADTEVSDQTTDVLLEAAVWDTLAVFRTIRRHKLPSEAGKRYERGVDAAVSIAALDRAATLLAEITGGTVEDSLTDVGSAPVMPTIAFDEGRPARVAGVDYPAGTARHRLEQVGCTVSGVDSDRFEVTPPTWRPDLTLPADLVEEVVRLEGLENIPSVLPTAPAGRGLTATQRGRRAVGHALAAAGHVEVLTSPFCDPSVFDAMGLVDDDERRDTMSVVNPLESEKGHLATTLLPSLVEIARRNLTRGTRDLALFSVAQVSFRTPTTGAVAMLPVDREPTPQEREQLSASLPEQPLHVASLYTGRRVPAGHSGPGREADALDAVEAARIVARALGAEVEVRAAEYEPWHPGRCVEVLVDGEVVGHAGELHPAVCERFGLPARSCAAELDLTAIGAREVLPAPSISAYPSVNQDVALVVDVGVPASAVEAALRSGGGDLLEGVRLFDVYTGAQLGEGRKSLAYALTFRAVDRTLTEDEATRWRTAAVDAAEAEVGASLRG
ncbi:phenylalanine--tRNA ligase subunit beta [Rhodococcus sp. IEGM 1408]|uniref:phenylalanine--tRNA ligase subunit beta n=1 Tax=Rhodococcus sp. IEGM 1408 TaxID=3082220 RepID=UPI0029537537|nr:phenylalanine--tRNA ligase subunit beta [Rhodococcus sp. IEGM 1408]MDV8001723.1 phenylalanine--tRNA ligase subunit beta [Rhodococcus sp. IEGM 1408]